MCAEGKKKTTMKEITSGFHYITSLRLLIKYITCFSAIPVILHKCVIRLPFIMCNCNMLQRCHREYLLWVEYLVKIFGKIPTEFPYPWQYWVSIFLQFASLLDKWGENNCPPDIGQAIYLHFLSSHSKFLWIGSLCIWK